MLGHTTLPDEEAQCPLEVEAHQAALPQDVPSWRSTGLLKAGLGFVVLTLVAVSACAIHPLETKPPNDRSSQGYFPGFVPMRNAGARGYARGYVNEAHGYNAYSSYGGMGYGESSLNYPGGSQDSLSGRTMYRPMQGGYQGFQHYGESSLNYRGYGGGMYSPMQGGYRQGGGMYGPMREGGMYGPQYQPQRLQQYGNYPDMYQPRQGGYGQQYGQYMPRQSRRFGAGGSRGMGRMDTRTQKNYAPGVTPFDYSSDAHPQHRRSRKDSYARSAKNRNAWAQSQPQSRDRQQRARSPSQQSWGQLDLVDDSQVDVRKVLWDWSNLWDMDISGYPSHKLSANMLSDQAMIQKIEQDMDVNAEGHYVLALAVGQPIEDIQALANVKMYDEIGQDEKHQGTLEAWKQIAQEQGLAASSESAVPAVWLDTLVTKPNSEESHEMGRKLVHRIVPWAQQMGRLLVVFPTNGQLADYYASLGFSPVNEQAADMPVGPTKMVYRGGNTPSRTQKQQQQQPQQQPPPQPQQAQQQLLPTQQQRHYNIIHDWKPQQSPQMQQPQQPPQPEQQQPQQMQQPPQPPQANQQEPPPLRPKMPQQSDFYGDYLKSRQQQQSQQQHKPPVQPPPMPPPQQHQQTPQQTPASGQPAPPTSAAAPVGLRIPQTQ